MLAVLLGADAASAANQFTYDVVIRNGRVLDGQGNPWVPGRCRDKGWPHRQDRQGRAAAARARSMPRGDYVWPGWIDMMDQSGEVLQRERLAENKLAKASPPQSPAKAERRFLAAEIPPISPSSRRQGISLNFGTYYSCRPGARRSDGRWRWRAHARRRWRR